jgi:hypothetical protein
VNDRVLSARAIRKCWLGGRDSNPDNVVRSRATYSTVTLFARSRG